MLVCKPLALIFFLNLCVCVGGWSVPFRVLVCGFLGAFASEKALAWHRNHASLMLDVAGGCLEALLDLLWALACCCWGLLGSPRVQPLCHALRTTCTSIGFHSDPPDPAGFIQSSACPRRHGGSAHGGAWAALGLPRGGGKEKVPFLKQIINKGLGWGSDFSEAVYSREMHVRLKGPGKLF